LSNNDGNALWWRVLQLISLLLGMVIAFLIVATWTPSGAVKAMFDPIVGVSTPSGNSTPGARASTQNGPDQISKLTQEVESQGATFSAERDELDYLTRIIVLMMTAVGIYTIILGVVSWKALDSQREEFERASKGSLASLERLRDELELDFPMLGRIQRNFKGILAALRGACQLLDVRDDSYSSLSHADVQQILFYENAVTTALLLDTKGYEKELSEIYRLLGIFYGSRFYSTTDDNKFDTSTTREHFDRARFYFERAIDLDPDNYTLFMHAGHFSQYYDNAAIAGLSRSYFERASEIELRFQKPLVSIALIELEAFNNSFMALEVLKRARSRKLYDQDREYSRVEYIAYLECCALCLKAQGQKEAERRPTLEDAAAKLRDAAKKPNEDWTGLRSFFEDDRRRYFAILENNLELAQGVAASIQRLESFVFNDIEPDGH
jgi:tetratricopeptide (TPR) repeat protein